MFNTHSRHLLLCVLSVLGKKNDIGCSAVVGEISESHTYAVFTCYRNYISKYEFPNRELDVNGLSSFYLLLGNSEIIFDNQSFRVGRAINFKHGGGDNHCCCQ